MRELPGYRPWLQIGPNRSKGQDFRLMPCHEHPGAIQLSPTFRPFAWCRGSWCSPFGSSFSAALKELAGDDVSRTLQHFFWKIIFFIFFHFFFRFYAYFSGDPFNAYVNSNISCPRPKPPCPVGSHWVRSWDSHRQCPATGASTFGQPKLGYLQPKLGMQPSLSNTQLDTSTETTKILGRLPNFIPKTSTICCFTVAPCCTIVLALILTYKACRLGGKASDPPGATQIGPDSFKNASTIPASFNELDAPISHEGALLLYQGLSSGINLE